MLLARPTSCNESFELLILSTRPWGNPERVGARESRGQCGIWPCLQESKFGTSLLTFSSGSPEKGHPRHSTATILGYIPVMVIDSCVSLFFPASALPVTQTAALLLAPLSCANAPALQRHRTHKETSWWRKAQTTLLTNPRPHRNNACSVAVPLSQVVVGLRIPRWVGLLWGLGLGLLRCCLSSPQFCTYSLLVTCPLWTHSWRAIA